MDLTHRFRVPAPVEEAWRAFNHLDRLAPCFPGATISTAEGDQFSGLVKVKLGPMALVYTGSGQFLERDVDARRVVFEVQGADRRGHGTATARVTASFVGNGSGTDVELLTDLALTGRPAQFGADVVTDVGNKLLDQFVSCVAGRFAAGLGAATGDEDDYDAAAVTSVVADDELWEEWAAAPDHPVEASDTHPTIELEPVGAGAWSAGADGADGIAEDHELDAGPPAAAEVTAPPPPYRYAPPSNLSRPSADVARAMVLTTLRRWGPMLGFVSLAVVILVWLLGRRRR